MANAEIRKTLKEQKIPYWKLGLEIGKSENTLIRWLRLPLSEEREKMIFKAINKIKREKK